MLNSLLVGWGGGVKDGVPDPCTTPGTLRAAWLFTACPSIYPHPQPSFSFSLPLSSLPYSYAWLLGFSGRGYMGWEGRSIFLCSFILPLSQKLFLSVPVLGRALCTFL